MPAGGRFTIARHGREPARARGATSCTCYVARNRTQGDYALHRLRLLEFVVFGTDAAPGNVTVRADVEARVEREATQPAP